MLDLSFGIVIFGVFLLTLMVDMAFLGVIIGFFLLAIAYLAGCDSLRKGEKSE